MTWLNRFLLVNWSHILDALLLTLALVCGIQIGESRVQKSWDAERKLIVQAQAKQEQHIADVRQSQSQITQEVSHEFAKRSKLLADRQLDSRVGGVCNVPTASGGNLSAVSEAPARAAPVGSDILPAASGDAGAVSCEQLIKDASQTTLMLMEVQRWYRAQSTIEP